MPVPFNIVRLTRIAVLLPALVLPALTGCKSVTAALAGDANLETAKAASATPKARKPGGTVDPAVSVVSDPNREMADAAALDNAQPAAQGAANLGAAVSQPTGIKAGQSSIFSNGASASASADPATIPQGSNGSVLAASAYAPAQGVNPLLYSVYGNAHRPLPTP